MSRTLSRQELIRSQWLHSLRTQGHRQCHGRGSELMPDGTHNVCAMEMLIRIIKEHELGFGPYSWTVQKYVGLNQSQVNEIICRNDGKPSLYGERYREHTFAEIADILEGWFAQEKAPSEGATCS